MITKNELDKLVEKYENPDFIKDDPVQFIHRYRNKKDIVEEIVSYNSLDDLIKKVDILIETKNNL